MDNISIYADKESKSSVTDNSQKYSSFAYSTTFMGNKKPFWLQDEEELKDESKSSSKTLRQYLLKNYKSHIHYNSSEPEKLGAKAFTKNAEVYLAPSEGEETLKHELGHVIQQKKEKIPVTTKIGEQQVNLDPKLEKGADEFAEHIESYIPEIISNESTNTETKNVIQFESPSDDEFKEIIRNVAQWNNIPTVIMDNEKVNDILKKIKLQYEDDTGLSLELLHRDIRDDPDFVLKMQVRKELEKDAECGIYLSLSEDRSKVGDRADDVGKESERITEIIVRLSTEKIFIGEQGEKDTTLHNVLSILTENQQKSVKNSILKLKNCCDAEGIKSVLQCANENASPSRLMLDFDATESEKNT